MSEQLKPCPFCGGRDIKVEQYDGENGGSYTYFACLGCGGHKEESFSYRNNADRSLEAAIAAWNFRPADPVKQALADALKEIVPEGGDWWCPTCKEALSGSRVTNSECCDTCGTYLGCTSDPSWMQKSRAALAAYEKEQAQ